MIFNSTRFKNRHKKKDEEVKGEGGEERVDGELKEGPEGGGGASGEHADPGAKAGAVFAVDRVEEEGAKACAES